MQKHFIYLDIETMSAWESYQKAPKHIRQHFKRTFEKYAPEDAKITKYWEEKAAVYAEFGKVICIGMGWTTPEGFTGKLFTSLDNEGEMLQNFADYLTKIAASAQEKSIQPIFVGHGSINFDIPMLCRRMAINRIAIPPVINPHYYKAYERPFEDTKTIWQFGQYNSHVSLSRLCDVLGVENPKADCDGSKVRQLALEGKINKIAAYCEGDVYATYCCHALLNGETPMSLKVPEATPQTA